MTTAPAVPQTEKHSPGRQAVKKQIERGGFCTLATASAGGKPHVVGINYAFVDGHLYHATGPLTKKVRNIRENPNVAVWIPVRKYPMGPPFSIQFQGKASILLRDDPEIASLLKAGKLKKITRFGVLEKEPDGLFIKVRPARRVHTYGLGIPLRTLIQNIARDDRTVTLYGDDEGSVRDLKG